MRLLEISPAAKRRAQKVVAHAKKKANWFNPKLPGWMSKIPGHDRKHQVALNSFRCVFSYTIDTDRNTVHRHLSVSVPGGKWPHTIAVKEIAKMFGFTGASEAVDDDYPKDWVVHLKKDDPVDDDCIVLGQDTGIKP